MWKSFLTAIGLLAAALLAALYSSSAGRDGRVLGAAISALVALGIAVWVAVKFVPRLASHVDWEWLPFFSHYHVTREGWMYFVAVVVVVFAAINTANNLLYMVLSAILAVLALSGFLSALNFRLVRIAMRVPSHCYAGEPFPITIQVDNEKRAFPTFSTTIGPTGDSPVRFSAFYVPVLRAREKVSQTGQGLLQNRGRYTLREVNVASRYPFGFFLKSRNYPALAEIICYPQILPEEQIDFASPDFRGEYQRFERGLGHDLYMIRDYVQSDSARHVHWKASAKTATLKTREYAAEESHRVIIAFDRFGQAGDEGQFEQLVSHAASIVHYLMQGGIEVRFVADNWEGSALEPILEYLALVQISSDAELPPFEDAAVNLSLRM